MQKFVNNAYDMISALVSLLFLWYSKEFYIDLKAISCRIEWSLFQVRSPKHARVMISKMNHYHKATTVAFQPQRVNLKYFWK